MYQSCTDNHWHNYTENITIPSDHLAAACILSRTKLHTAAMETASLIPRPSHTPAFVACSTNAGGGLVNRSLAMTLPRRWVDVRRSGTFPEKLHVSECATYRKHGPWNDWALNIRQSLRHFLGSESHFTAIQKECATPPRIHPTSKYIICVGSVYQTGVRRPGYEDRKQLSDC